MTVAGVKGLYFVGSMPRTYFEIFAKEYVFVKTDFLLLQ